MTCGRHSCLCASWWVLLKSVFVGGHKLCCLARCFLPLNEGCMTQGVSWAPNTSPEQKGKILLWLQEIMAREQEILCEELAQFVNVLEGRTDLGVADAKRWTLKEWMATIFPVRQPATGCSRERLSHLAHEQAACWRLLAQPESRQCWDGYYT